MSIPSEDEPAGPHKGILDGRNPTSTSVCATSQPHFAQYPKLRALIDQIIASQQQGALVRALHQNTVFLEALDAELDKCNAFFTETLDNLASQQVVIEQKLSQTLEQTDPDLAVIDEYVSWSGSLSAAHQFRLLTEALVRAISLRHDSLTDFVNARDILEAFALQPVVASPLLQALVDSRATMLSTVELNAPPVLAIILRKQQHWDLVTASKMAARDVTRRHMLSVLAFVWRKLLQWLPFLGARGGWQSVLMAVSVLLLLIYEHLVIFVVRPDTLGGLLYASFPVASILAVANAANDAANSMGTAYGAKAMTMSQALITGGVLEFAGAIIMGSFVAKTISKGVIEPESYEAEPVLFSVAMLAVLLGAALTTLIATIWGYPISATHGIIAGLAVVGGVAKGGASIGWASLGMTCVGWVGSPLAGMLSTCLVYYLILKLVLLKPDPQRRAKVLGPVFSAFTFAISAVFIMLKGPHELQPDPMWLLPIIAVGVGLLGSLCVAGAEAGLKKYRLSVAQRELTMSKETSSSSSDDDDDAHPTLSAIPPLPKVDLESPAPAPRRRVGSILPVMVRGRVGTMEDVSHVTVIEGAEKAFVPLLILSALTVAFAHGGNDVGNAVGPLAAIQQASLAGRVVATPAIPLPILLLGSAGFLIGILALGSRTISTVGTKITQLTPSRSFATQLGAAVAVLASSALGLPVSTSHCLVGSVVGIGIAQRFAGISDAKIDPSMLKKILLGWVLTIPLAAIIALVAFLAVAAAVGVFP